MKILVVADQYVKKNGDSFFCIENVYDILKRFAQLGELSICVLKYNGKSSNVIESPLDDVVKPQNIFYLSQTYVKTIGNSLRTLDACVANSSLVIGYVPSINAETACGIARKYGKPYLAYVVACPWDAFWNHGFLGKFIAPYEYFMMKRCLKKSDYALYVTERFLQKRYPCFGATCGCSDVRIPDFSNEILARRLSFIESNKMDVVRIATIASYSVAYKGQHFVIKALAQLKKKGVENFHYHLIGGGDKTRLEKLAKKLGVEKNVHFEGVVPHNRIFEKLDGMHVYIQPSLQEGLPRSVVEAMSRGLLCICANTAAMPEMVEPEYVVNRKSVKDIAFVLQKLTVAELRKQAVRNFNEAMCYCEDVLNEKRNIFFDVVMKNVCLD